MSRGRRALAPLALVLLLIALAPRLDAYLKLGTFTAGGALVGIQWDDQPIRYFVANRSVNGVSAEQLQAALGRAFEEWQRPANLELSSQFNGFTGASSFQEDGVSVIGFEPHPEFNRTLGATTFIVDDNTGAILESDIFLNSIFNWSVAPAGQSGRFDVESILVHEVGHLLGLGHSALGETQLSGGGRSVLGKRAVMFPIAFSAGSIADRTIEADDVAGITDIYGTSQAQQSLGAISGRVTVNGVGVLGAHVTAFNPATGDMVSGFTLTGQGEFVIGALRPGQYIVRAEPLDDADIDSFFDETTPIDVNFQVAYFGRQVLVPAGGASSAIEIKVRRK